MRVKFLIVCFISVGLIAGLVHAAGEEKAALEKEKQVLILISADYGMPWYSIATEAMYATFKAEPGMDVTLITEYAGIDCINTNYMLKLRDLYRQKYAGRKIDLIIAPSDPATDFLVQYGNDLFPGTPIVAISETERMDIISGQSNMTGIIGTVEIQNSLELALGLHPDTKRVAVVSGAAEYDRFYEEKARKVFRKYEHRLEFIYLANVPMNKMLHKLARLPEHTIVFYLLTLADWDGKHLIPRETVNRIAQVSNAPVYGLWDTFLGYGIVGGHLSSAEVAGNKAAAMGLRILRGTDPKEIPVVRGFSAYMFDWRRLKKWGISEKNLPPNSVVRYREKSFWNVYKWPIAIYTLAVLVAGFGYGRYKTKVFIKRLEEHERIHRLLEKKVEERTADLRKANAELERLSNIDGLTSLHNRRYFDTLLKSEWKRHCRIQSPLSLIICDIDYFKKYNDTYGHHEGDDCLKMVARAIRDNTRRPSDIAARYGGEEFALILSDTNSVGAVTVAENIKNAIKQLGIPHSASLAKPIVSASFGVATIIPEQTQKSDVLIRMADKALYQSKEKGRDRIRQFQGMANHHPGHLNTAATARK